MRMILNPIENPAQVREHSSQVLATLRKQKGLSQTQLAQELRVTRNVICDIEIGRIHMNEEILAKVATFFKVSTDFVLGLADAPVPVPTLSLRLTRRFNRLQNLSPVKQRSVLHTLDLALRGVDPDFSDENEDPT